MMKSIILAIAVFFVSIPIHSQCKDCIFSCVEDLNSDGIPDTIFLEVDTLKYTYTLFINDKAITRNVTDVIEYIKGFKTIDIDTTNLSKEVLIQVPYIGAVSYDVFCYGNNLSFAGNIVNPIFNKDGRIRSHKYPFKTVVFELDILGGVLKEITQPFYGLNDMYPAVHKAFPICQDLDLKNIIELVEVGREIEIVLIKSESEDFRDDKYLIKTKYGLLGWTNYKVLRECTQIFSAG